MPQYRYKAVTRDGQVLEGTMEAADQSTVVARIREAGQTPIRADEVRVGGLEGFRWRGLLKPRGLTQREVGALTLELAALLHAGLPLDRALQIMIGLADDARVRQFLLKIQEAVRGGASLSSSLEGQAGVFSPFYISMVRAAEASGSLDTGLARLAEYLERTKALKDKALSALIYPGILAMVAGLSLVIIFAYVVPKVSELFEDAGRALPFATQVVLAVSDLIRHYWWTLLVGGGAVVVYARRRLRRPEERYRWDARLLRVPVLGNLVRALETAQFSRSLGTLLGNGVTLLNALAVAKDTLSNRVLANAVADAAGALKEGKGLAEPLMQTGIFPRLALQMLKVGEETGRLEEMLLNVADIYDRETATAVQRLLALLEPLLIVSLGLVIGGVIMSIIMAIVSVNDLVF